MPTVFLSYARDNTDRVRPLASALEQAGHTVWWDQHIGGGDQFGDAIERALGTARVVVVAWSEQSVRSAWVRDEAASGRDTNRLVPVTLDGCRPPLGFRQYQTIDLSKWKGAARSAMLKPLHQAICAKADCTPLDDKLQSAPAAPRAANNMHFRRRWPAITALLLLLLLTAALFYPRPLPWSASDSIAPRIRMGEFAPISANVPAGLPRALNEEILAAFGSENLVSIITAGAGNGSAPFLLEGSIRKLDDALRFTVSLKNVDTGAVIWSQAYDRLAADALAPRQVAVAASQVVRCGLWGASTYPKRMSDRGLALYLQFCGDYWGGSADEQEVLQSARRVTASVPDFSFGWSALALAAVPLSHRAGSAEAGELTREAWTAAEKSIQLDQLNPEGYMAMAGLLPMEQFARREHLLRKAIAVRPTECGCERGSYGDFLASVGRVEEAVEQFERARAMIPLAPLSNVRLAHALHVVERHDEADRIVDETLQMWPDAAILRLLKVKAAFWTGDYGEVLPLLQTPGMHLTDEQRAAMAASLEALRSGSADRKSQALVQLEAMANNPRKNDRMVIAAIAALGDDAAALRASQALIRNRGPALAAVLFEPNLADFAVAPQYAELVKRLGLTGYWTSTGKMPDICAAPQRPNFCATA